MPRPAVIAATIVPTTTPPPIASGPVDAAPGAWTVHCDGSASPNPGRMGIGVRIAAPDGRLHDLSLAWPERGCNNEAELRAVMAALVELRRLGTGPALICSDNSIVVAQLTQAGAPPLARLAPLFDEARALLAAARQAGDVQLRWVPRHRNGAADALSRAAVGLPPKGDTVARKRSKRRKR